MHSTRSGQKIRPYQPRADYWNQARHIVNTNEYNNSIIHIPDLMRIAHQDINTWGNLPKKNTWHFTKQAEWVSVPDLKQALDQHVFEDKDFCINLTSPQNSKEEPTTEKIGVKLGQLFVEYQCDKNSELNIYFIDKQNRKLNLLFKFYRSTFPFELETLFNIKAAPFSKEPLRTTDIKQQEYSSLLSNIITLFTQTENLTFDAKQFRQKMSLILWANNPTKKPCTNSLTDQEKKLATDIANNLADTYFEQIGLNRYDIMKIFLKNENYIINDDFLNQILDTEIGTKPTTFIFQFLLISSENKHSRTHALAYLKEIVNDIKCKNYEASDFKSQKKSLLFASPAMYDLNSGREGIYHSSQYFSAGHLPKKYRYPYIAPLAKHTQHIASFDRKSGQVDFSIRKLKMFAQENVLSWSPLESKHWWYKSEKASWQEVKSINQTLDHHLFQDDDFCIRIGDPTSYIDELRIKNTTLEPSEKLTEMAIVSQANQQIGDGRTPIGVKLGKIYIEYTPCGKGSFDAAIYILDAQKQKKVLLFDFRNSRYGKIEFNQVIPFTLSSFYGDFTSVGSPKPTPDQRIAAANLKKLLTVLALNHDVNPHEVRGIIGDFVCAYDINSNTIATPSQHEKSKVEKLAHTIANELAQVYYDNLYFPDEELQEVLFNYKDEAKFTDEFLTTILNSQLDQKRYTIRQLFSNEENDKEGISPLEKLRRTVANMHAVERKTKPKKKYHSIEDIEKLLKLPRPATNIPHPVMTDDKFIAIKQVKEIEPASDSTNPNNELISMEGGNEKIYNEQDVEPWNGLIPIEKIDDDLANATSINTALASLNEAMSNELIKHEKRPSLYKKKQDELNQLISRTNAITQKYITLNSANNPKNEKQIQELRKEIRQYKKDMNKFTLGQKVFIAACVVVGAILGAIAGFFLGALAGGTLGSVVPGAGNVAGAGLGGVIGAIKAGGIGAEVGLAVGTAGIALMSGAGASFGFFKSNQTKSVSIKTAAASVASSFESAISFKRVK